MPTRTLKMPTRTMNKAPTVRLPPKSNFELLLVRGSQVAMIFVGIIATVFALHAGEFILTPIGLGIVIGLMLGPIATRLERFNVPSALSAAIVVLLFILSVCLFAMLVASPLSFWLQRLPQIWAQLATQLSDLKGPLETFKSMRDQLRQVTGGEGLSVSVDEGTGVETMATLAPAVIARVLLFFASLYFFVATRYQTRTAILRVCFNRRLRWRVAHIFRDVEQLVSQYLLSITVINVAEGLTVGIGLYLLGVPSAPLWGALAIVTNFVPFVGPLVMVAILFAVGLTEFDTLGMSLLPVILYLGVNTVEGQFVTPYVIGKTMTLNPFVVLLALAFWIWLWGAVGGFIAIPALLVGYAIIRNVLPGVNWGVDELDRRYSR
ncbi:AI-2E family transporter [Aminobacter sp. AP02]|uniref:AI-2E family transporter n=1 Tax=Aminobacter sp. AP02 TaxID=2135737 RepID=UPI000D793290|nr:AI-2E family transporter [Aminobacter sp. AP02]PWK64945.1 putative PurR-regulated permease PerM [Aminobacter sp. AP02]